MKFTQIEINFLKSNYSILGTQRCAKKLNRTTKSVSHKANRLGLELNPNTKSKIYQKSFAKRLIEHPFPTRKSKRPEQFKVNPNQFINCTIPEAAYILGLLWADGYIRQKDYLNDIKLENIKKDIDVFYPIFLKTGNWRILFRQRKNRQEQGLIRTSNKLLASFLIENNYGPHNIKSADKILELIPNNLHQYWFRGLIDGDGCWYLNIKNSCRQFSLAGSYEQDWSYFENLLDKLDIKYSTQRRIQKRKNKKPTKSSTVRINNKKDIIKLGNYIYQNYGQDKTGLQRKYNKYLEIKNS